MNYLEFIFICYALVYFALTVKIQTMPSCMLLTILSYMCRMSIVLHIAYFHDLCGKSCCLYIVTLIRMSAAALHPAVFSVLIVLQYLSVFHSSV